MIPLNRVVAWKRLSEHHDQVRGLHMRDLFAQDAQRFQKFSLRLGDLLFDFSKNRITGETLELLLNLARQSGLEPLRTQLFAGKAINITENRAVAHWA